MVEYEEFNHPMPKNVKGHWLCAGLHTGKLHLFYLSAHFMPLVSFYTPWKHQKTRGFLMPPGGTERDQWHEMCWSKAFCEPNCLSVSDHFMGLVFKGLSYFHRLLLTSNKFNSFQSSTTFHIETSHLICTENQDNGFYMECTDGLK